MKDIVESFQITYNNDAVYDIIADVGDVTLDAIMNGGALDGVPVLGLIKGIYKGTQHIQMRRLMEKVYKFLFLSKDTTFKERQEFMDEYTERNREEGCEALLTLLDRLDNTHKVNIIVNLMKAKMNGDITIDDFIRLCVIVERIPFSDFKELPKYTDDFYEAGASDMLLSAGVLNNTVIGAGDYNRYRLNSLGVQLLRYGLSYDVAVEVKLSTHLAALEWQEIK